MVLAAEPPPLRVSTIRYVAVIVEVALWTAFAMSVATAFCDVGSGDGVVELVHPASTSVMTTAATTTILRTERIMALGRAGASRKQPQPVGTVTGGDTASSVPLTMGEMSTALPSLHKKMPRTWMAVSTLNDADMFGGVTLIEVATGHGVDVCWMSLLRMMKPAEAASPGGSTILGTPGGQMPVWLTVTCKGVPALLRKVTTG
jgi:hypothetical protein